MYLKLPRRLPSRRLTSLGGLIRTFARMPHAADDKEEPNEGDKAGVGQADRERLVTQTADGIVVGNQTVERRRLATCSLLANFLAWQSRRALIRLGRVLFGSGVRP